MAENEIILNWKKFLNTNDLNKEDNKIHYSGVYIWGFQIDNKFLPYYVGKSNNIYIRIIDHLRSIIGGAYTIYHKDKLEEFKEYKNHSISTEGKLYELRGENYQFFLEKRKELEEHIDFMIDKFRFTYAEVDKNKKLKEIEYYLISKIGKENLSNRNSGTSIYNEINHEGNKTIKELFKTNA